MRPANNGDAAGPGNLVPVPGCIDRVEAVAGDVTGRCIDGIQPEPVPFTGRTQDCVGVPGRMDDPPVDLHDERWSVLAGLIKKECPGIPETVSAAGTG